MKLRFQDQYISLADRIALMGIVNVTPDSFSEHGDNFDPQNAVRAALRMAEDGADIVDVGGESSRPGAQPIPADEEIRRIAPVIAAIRRQSNIPISVDTWKSDVARAALDHGANIINDISGFHRDDAMRETAREYRAGCVIMHMRGTPATMQMDTHYTDLLQEISDYFQNSILRLQQVGIDREYLCLDPGIGFGKTATQNLQLINNLDAFAPLRLPILVGPSRKSFLGTVLGIAVAKDRQWGTAAAICCAILRGARMVRVHDIREMRQVCLVTQAVMSEQRINSWTR